ncbi:MAG TPA: DUF4397 domain-containing protein [Sediminibacterium sp.]|nr:DUF4397 domain-containing protein [Sediminibacterium sp.]
MKKISLKYIIPAAAFLFLYACTKNDGVTNQAYSAYGTSGTAGQLKVILGFAYTVDYNTMVIKINDKVVSNALQTRTPFPGGGYNTRGSNFPNYLSVPQGSNKIAVVIPKKGTAEDSIVLYTTNITIPDNAPYTLHIADTAANTQSKLVKNEIAKVDTGHCRFRFVNLIPNLPAVDIYLNGQLIKNNVAFMAATDTFTLKTGVNAPGYVSGNATTWDVRPAGAAITTKAIATYSSGNTLQSERVMTIFTMGYSGSTGTRLPYVSFTLDKNQ